jgi:CDGSH-type Zn-finger protein
MKSPKPVPTLELRPNGPYRVKDLEELVAADGQALPVKPLMALCRCGKSGTKPFCDGTHNKVGFSGARQAPATDDVRATYAGRDITVHDNRSLCSHAGACTDALTSVFRSGQSPWIDPDGAPAEAIAAAIAACPSGALSYAINGREYVEPPTGPRITLEKNGPYRVTGGVELLNEPFRQGASPRRYSLCRCGQSKNKPFCDGSHWDAGFEG